MYFSIVIIYIGILWIIFYFSTANIYSLMDDRHTFISDETYDPCDRRLNIIISVFLRDWNWRHHRKGLLMHVTMMVVPSPSGGLAPWSSRSRLGATVGQFGVLTSSTMGKAANQQ